VDLIEGIRAYLARYVDFTPEFFAVAPYYVLLSWVFDRFEEVPLVRFRGGFGTGKTRALLAFGSICYKPFFASGASTVSPIFHILDAFRGTLVLDEADFRFSDMTGELVKVLNNGSLNGLPVLRTMANRNRELNPRAFRVFGPKILAMRESFDDPALESRLITEEMTRRPLSSHIPIHTPRALQQEALALRNRLLAWRLQHWGTIVPDPSRAIAGADPRTNQMALALLSLVDDEQERACITRWLSDQGSARDRALQYKPEALVLAAAVEAFAQASSPYVLIADVAARFNERVLAHGEAPMTNKWVGSVVRRLGIPTAKSRGVYGIPIRERTRIRALADRLGVSCNPTADDPSPASSLTELLVSQEEA
jgi:hypothetical protein